MRHGTVLGKQTHYQWALFGSIVYSRGRMELINYSAFIPLTVNDVKVVLSSTPQ